MTSIRADVIPCGDRGVVWRLLAANGRVLACSATSARRAADSRLALMDVLRNDPQWLRILVTRSLDSPEWRWTLVDSGTVQLARSARGYSRRAQAHKSAEHVLTLLASDLEVVWVDCPIP